MTTRLVLALVLLAALGGYVALRRGDPLEATLSEVAGAVAGRSVRVECPGTFRRLTEISPHDGSVAFGADGKPGDTAELSGKTCSYLERLVEGEAAADLACLASGSACSLDAQRTAVAVNVLAHESYHLAGERSEGVTQCYALQTNARVALRLGATPAEAEALAAFVLAHVQPALPPDYHSADCRDGGLLDLHPERPTWP